ncbi:MAG: hypothetical protein JNN12_06135 [Bacteroidetes Order II. Incertae sedis bacterium]|nr:hypothetical protein [Bacteroidetes Order II. bacterium]
MRRFFVPIFLVLLAACDSWVQDVPYPAGVLSEEALSTEIHVPAQVAALHNTFAESFGALSLWTDMVSDAVEPDEGAAISLRDVMELEQRSISPANAYSSEAFHLVHQLRYLSDALRARVEKIGPFKDPALRNRAMYYAHLYKGISRYFLATYFGMNEGGAGVPVESGKLVTADILFSEALASFEAAQPFVPSATDSRLLQTLRARVYLLADEPLKALMAAQNGLKPGDVPFRVLFSESSPNPWFTNRAIVMLPMRLAGIVKLIPAEAARIPVEEVRTLGKTVFRVSKYTNRTTPMVFASWQENELMLAELELPENVQSARARVNSVRSIYDLSPLTQLSAQDVLDERDRTLFGTGLRLLDQRRKNLWPPSSGQWKYLPVSAVERIRNPNLN